MTDFKLDLIFLLVKLKYSFRVELFANFGSFIGVKPFFPCPHIKEENVLRTKPLYQLEGTLNNKIVLLQNFLVHHK